VRPPAAYVVPRPPLRTFGALLTWFARSEKIAKPLEVNVLYETFSSSTVRALRARPAPIRPAPIGPIRRVLVVDDNEDVADLLCDYLSSRGLEATSAHDARSALRTADTLRPDMVLLDIDALVGLGANGHEREEHSVDGNSVGQGSTFRLVLPLAR
jgi:hypothetical protein